MLYTLNMYTTTNFEVSIHPNGDYSAEVLGHTVVLVDEEQLLLVRDEDGEWMDAAEALQDEFETDEECDDFLRDLENVFTALAVQRHQDTMDERRPGT